MDIAQRWNCVDQYSDLIRNYPGCEAMVETLFKTILSNNTITSQAGPQIVSETKVVNLEKENDDDVLFKIDTISASTPRGKFDITFSRDKLKLKAKNKEIFLVYDNIAYVFDVPKANHGEIDHAFVFVLKSPIINGKQKLNYVVLELKNISQIIKVEPEIPEMKESSSQYKCITHIVNQILGENLVKKPNNSCFVSSEFKSYLKCYKGVKDGLLYPLDEGLLFLSPPIFIHRNTIENVQILRGGSRTFDCEVLRIDGEKPVEFTMLESAEQTPLESYIRETPFNRSGNSAVELLRSTDNTPTKIPQRPSSEGGTTANSTKEAGEDVELDSDEDDEDFDVGLDSDDLSYGSGESSEDDYNDFNPSAKANDFSEDETDSEDDHNPRPLKKSRNLD